ncbi:MAG: ABC-F family ATP-binding cassette domain-containing protein [Actinomycetia bacterium]|nr:ABC-F family ATP-binding cassette domain-containing protein [Actinomycetes bacterium]
MGHIDVNSVSFSLTVGQRLLDQVSFTVGEREHVALIGANGVGKTTMLRLIAGVEQPNAGVIGLSGSVAFMRQMTTDDSVTVRDLYLSLSPERYREAAAQLTRAEKRLADTSTSSSTEGAAGGSSGEDAGLRYAKALTQWEDLGGYDLEVTWAASADRAVGNGWSALADRSVTSFSGGEQKRLVLELLFSSEHEILLLDEPDNFLDIPGKSWLADRLNESDKTILFVSHDRQLLADAASKLVTIESHGAWSHGGSFDGWAEAREARKVRIDDEHKRWAAERKRLHSHMRIMKQRAAVNDGNASRARAAETRLRHFDEAGPPPDKVRDQKVTMRLAGSRSGKRVVMAEQLELTDLTFPFDLELWYGDRLAVVGHNGTGKSHFLRLLAGDEVATTGSWRLGANVKPGLFSQLHTHPEWQGRRLLDLLADHELARGPATNRLRRYELADQADQGWETLSGGQQARFQILLLEIGGANLLLLDEPTDNLDVASAEALEVGLAAFEGTVLAVSHDRWFLRSFDWFLVFQDDAEVVLSHDPEAALSGV